ncbi:nucleosome assembly protein 1 [Phytophthora cinnamomi]|uniref:nucleosome assembly protein 1 n=1 Tax=Phytophthora cinnamomi TaxID=4785 RepID=UPI00355AAB36|nr:nucleosome assembly protein 1 [Phytophthora cinnamomi]
MSDKPVAEQDTVVEVDQHDGRGFQPVEGVTEQVAQLAVGDAAEGEEEEDDLANLPKNVLLRLDALRKLQEAQAEVEEEFEKERKALELKYEKLYQPFYQQRAEIVSGAKEVEAVTAAAAEPQQADADAEEDVKGVPGFWLRAFMNHSVLAELIQERDLPAFEFLTDALGEPRGGQRLQAHVRIRREPFFANKSLTKEYDIGDASELGEAVLRNVTGTVMEWKEGQNLCEVTKKVKQRAKGGKGETRVVSRTEPCESFFQFFTPVEMPSEEDDEDSEMIMRQLSGDFEIGFTIHETIIPQALLWFTGEAVEDDDSDYDPEEDEDYEDSDEESLSGDEVPCRVAARRSSLPWRAAPTRPRSRLSARTSKLLVH